MLRHQYIGPRSAVTLRLGLRKPLVVENWILIHRHATHLAASTSVGIGARRICARIGDCATRRCRSVPSIQRGGSYSSNRTWKSVTHVPGRFCYLSPRPLTWTSLAATGVTRGPKLPMFASVVLWWAEICAAVRIPLS